LACRVLCVTSAHKGTSETLKIVSEYEADGIATVFVCVAGGSNGLGPVVAGNTSYPVINCPPISSEHLSHDVWSSLRVPSGVGCATVLSPDAAAQCAASMLGLNDHVVWARLRVKKLLNYITLNQNAKWLEVRNDEVGEKYAKMARALQATTDDDASTLQMHAKTATNGER